MNDDNPLLSVCLITYNHAGYIERAIKGALKQEVHLEWEIIIADDCSTDGTAEIVKTYADLYPSLIRTITQDQNVGAAANFEQLLSAARGKYIAYCEGDDYWTDPGKLEKQVDFLESNSDFSACFHNATVEYDYAGTDSHKLVNAERDVFTFGDVIQKNFSVPTCSLVFRNIFQGKLPSNLILLDWVLLLLLAREGKIKYINETMAVKTQHSGGWTSKNWTKKAKHLVEITLRCKTYFGPEYSEEFDKVLAADYADISFGHFQDGEIREFRDSLKQCLRYERFLSPRKRRALKTRGWLSRSPMLARGFNSIARMIRRLIRPHSDIVYLRS